MNDDLWPALPYDAWQKTYATLHMWTQVVGKVAVAQGPALNHGWGSALQLTPRGLITRPLSHDARSFTIEFDFLAHHLSVCASDGERRTLTLEPRAVADFHRDTMSLLREMGFPVKTWPMPVEVSEPIPFEDDTRHHSYDPEFANRFWRILLQSERVLMESRCRFVGKCSPVHFFWGSFDLACTRFNGARAPQHPGGVPGLADWVTREAYSHACTSAGWWPGAIGSPMPDPVFYAYAYPEPPGCPTAKIRPDAGYYHSVMHEWILPYDAVRNAANPDAMVLEFFQSTYEAAATLGNWDRPALERVDAPHAE